jgi:outer membrane biosynthesis protein TonB
VDKEGKATNPRVITPPSMFDYSALEAAATYRYKPALKNGQPVSVTMNIIIVFKYTMRPT